MVRKKLLRLIKNLAKANGIFFNWLKLLSATQRQTTQQILDYSRELEAKMAARTAALRESRARNRAILNAIPDLIALINIDGIFVEKVKTMPALELAPLGKSYIGRHLTEVLPPDIAALELQAIQAMFATGEVQVYEQQLQVGDRLQHEEVRVVPYSDKVALVMVRDISARKQVEIELQQTSQQLTLHIENSPLATILWDCEFRIQYWSKQAERIFGWTAAEVIGKSWAELNFVCEKDLKQVSQVVQSLLEGLRQTVSCNRNYRKDGVLIDCEWFNSTLINETGKLTSILSQVQDVSQRKRAELDRQQAEAQLRKREAQLAEAQKIAHTGNWEIDLVSHAKTWSDEMYQIFGFNPAHLPPSLTDFIEQVDVGDRDSFESAIISLGQTGQPEQFEYRFRHAQDQSLRHIESRATVIRYRGKIIRIFGTCLDITKRKQVEEKLRKQEEQLRLITDALPVFIAYSDTQQRYQFVNKTYETFFGKPRAWFYGKHLREVVGAENYAHVQGYIERVLTGEAVNYEVAMPIQDIADRYCSIALVPDFDESNQVQGYYGLITDITTRRRIEATLRQNQARFESLATAVPGQLYTLLMRPDGSLMFEYSNQAIEDIVEIPLQQFLANPNLTLDLIHPEDRASYQTAVEQSAKTLTSFRHEWRIITPSSKVKWVQASSQPERREDGGICWHGIMLDITDRKAIDRLKSEFISIVSHELRTPLTGIRGALGLLSSGVYNNRPERANRMIEIALEDSDRLVRLVDDILDLERLESSDIQLKLEVCNAIDLLQRAIEVMYPAAEQASISFIAEPTQIQVLAAPDAILQTLTNLLSNAIKFSPTGSTVKLSTSLTSGSIPTIPALLAAGNGIPYSLKQIVRFKVQDEGRGIPPDKLECIFERFQQVDVSDSRQKGGTGLGLAICYKIVQQHGGKIWAESILFKGSTFYFTLPTTEGAV